MGTVKTLKESCFRSRKNKKALAKKNGRAKTAVRHKVLFEPLEPRMLMSDFTYVGSTAFDLTLKYSDAGGQLQLVDSSSNVVKQEAFDISDPTSTASITGSAGTDKLTIDFSTLSTFNGSIDFTDATTTDNDTLAIVGRANEWYVTDPNGGIVDAAAGVSFSGIENIKGGSDSDAFILFETGTVSGAIDGGGGTDTLAGPDISIDWYITDTSSGLLESAETSLSSADAPTPYIDYIYDDNGNIIDSYATSDVPFNLSGPALYSQIFNSIENLVGGSGSDTFTLYPGGSLIGSIDGGGGENILSYANYSLEYTVDLDAGTATGVGGVANIDGAYGHGSLNWVWPTIESYERFGEKDINTSIVQAVNNGGHLIVETRAAHGLADKSIVRIRGVEANRNIADLYQISWRDATHFELLDADVNDSAWMAGGKIAKQEPNYVQSFGAVQATSPADGQPIVITTAAPHKLTNANAVKITGVRGNTNANGIFNIEVINATSFRLKNTASNAAYSGGGRIFVLNHFVPVGTVADATNTDAIIITANESLTTVESGNRVNLVDGNKDVLLVCGVNGNTNANGIFSFRYIEANVVPLTVSKLELKGAVGSGAWTSGGQIFKVFKNADHPSPYKNIPVNKLKDFSLPLYDYAVVKSSSTQGALESGPVINDSGTVAFVQKDAANVNVERIYSANVSMGYIENVEVVGTPDVNGNVKIKITSKNHGLQAGPDNTPGDHVRIVGVTGTFIANNTASQSAWQITEATPDTFSFTRSLSDFASAGDAPAIKTLVYADLAGQVYEGGGDGRMI